MRCILQGLLFLHMRVPCPKFCHPECNLHTRVMLHSLGTLLVLKQQGSSNLSTVIKTCGQESVGADPRLSKLMSALVILASRLWEDAVPGTATLGYGLGLHHTNIS